MKELVVKNLKYDIDEQQIWRHNESFKSLYEGYCNLMTTTGYGDGKEFLSFFLDNTRKVLEGIGDEEKVAAKEAFPQKEKCTYTFIETASESNLENFEEYCNSNYNTDYEFLECKK
ncbi:MAG: hypothetical protein PHI22_02995 [Bacilli bacterium]|nr:hypothetical protein [Bacilli bacterium]MDD4298349.1 hypothetical protein [Bacilli bacterium]